MMTGAAVSGDGMLVSAGAAVSGDGMLVTAAAAVTADGMFSTADVAMTANDCMMVDDVVIVNVVNMTTMIADARLCACWHHHQRVAERQCADAQYPKCIAHDSPADDCWLGSTK